MSSVSAINFKGGESIGSIGQNNNPPVQCPTCGGKVAFKGDSVEISGKKKNKGLKAFLGLAVAALATVGGLTYLGKKGHLNNLKDGRLKTIVEKLKLDKAAKKCSDLYEQVVNRLKSGFKPKSGDAS
ncbi:MAG: hypothetical protein E7Z92_01395 [Cyanobacteria bacterium SIG31]|nr:hypothetical protein [Cyanobacteria bacterium SIG31]